MHLGFQNQSFRVHQEVAFPATHLLAAIVSARFSSHPGGLGRLGVHYPSAGVRIPTRSNPKAFAQRRVEPLEGAIEPPLAEPVIDGLPGWEITGQKSPRAAAPQDVEDRVEQGTWRVGPGSTTGLRGRQKGVQACPVGGGEIGRVCAHALERTLPAPHAGYFSDSFSRNCLENRQEAP